MNKIVILKFILVCLICVGVAYGIAMLIQAIF